VADVYSKEKRSEIMSRVRNKRTSAEEEVSLMLRNLGVRFRRNVKSLPGEPDLVVFSAKAVIFVHGCFWHNHSGCKRAKLPKSNQAFWIRKIESNRKRDQRVARQLRNEGWRVINVWQCRLRDKEKVMRFLNRMLRERIK
jgi:DNA mismatch endonuclease (patch repair protein)